jgi:hypothetical protein
MTRSYISIFLLMVGLLWAAVVTWFFVMVGGAEGLTSAYLPKTLLWFSWLFVGPLVLIAGAVLSRMANPRKVGWILSLVGRVILTAMVGYQVLWAVHDAADPLIAKPPYSLYTIAVVLTLLADAGAVRLYQLASPAVTT